MSNTPPPPFGQPPQEPGGPSGQTGPPPGWGTPPPGVGGPPSGPPPQQGGPGQGSPGFGPPPGPGGPGYGQPGYGGPGSAAPGYGAPGYGAPGYGAPGYGAPGYGAPGYGGGPPGGQGQPSSSKAPLVVGIIAALIVIGAGVGAFVVLSGDGGGSDVAVVGSEEQVTEGGQGGPRTPPPAPDAPEPPEDPDGADAPPPQAPSGGDTLEIGESTEGEVTSAEPTQVYTFTAAAGSPVEITMDAVDPDLDPLLRLYGPDGELLEEADDIDFPDDRDARITTILPEEGEYRIEATSFGGTSSGRFELLLTVRSALTADDTLSPATPEISYEYEGVPGTTVVIDMVATDDEIDPALRLIAPDGSTVADDDDGGDGLDARIEHTIEQAGTYTVVASTFGENYGSYTLTVSEG